MKKYLLDASPLASLISRPEVGIPSFSMASLIASVPPPKDPGLPLARAVLRAMTSAT